MATVTDGCVSAASCQLSSVLSCLIRLQNAKGEPDLIAVKVQSPCALVKAWSWLCLCRALVGRQARQPSMPAMQSTGTKLVS